MFEDVNADDASGHLDLLPIAGTGWDDTGGRGTDKGKVSRGREDSGSAQVMAMRDGGGHSRAGTRRARV